MKRFRAKNPTELKLRKLYNRSSCQARHRSQDWNITWEDFLDIWLEDDNYKKIGIGKDSLNLCRKNKTIGWSIENVYIERRTVNSRHRFIVYGT